MDGATNAIARVSTVINRTSFYCLDFENFKLFEENVSRRFLVCACN
jgi:hypothetical protein